MDWNSVVAGCVSASPVYDESGQVVRYIEVATLRCVPALFQNVVQAALVFAGVVALVFILLAGYGFVTSGGDPERVASARRTAIFAVVGLLIVLCSFAFVSFVASITGVECVNHLGFDQCGTVPAP